MHQEDLVKLHLSKTHKTPWNKVKDIIQTRKESLRKKQNRLSTKSDDCRTDWSTGSDQEDVFEPLKQEIIETSGTVSVTVTEPEEIYHLKFNKNFKSHEYDNKIPSSVLARYQQITGEDKFQVITE